ncbi:fatty acid desaturase [Conexibacter sp. SYSU D00693]|uniref:fatty acid desaturase n=1 Tax=Conexibacter sp. SYSU D00693 TaxID=2812560 RepID=UPI00196B27D3|nr:fatty acid desaturase [Conexibacter sp. SYSU D00693]
MSTQTLAPHPADQIRRIPDPAEPIPAIALPVLGLFLGGHALFWTSTALTVSDVLPWPVGMLLNAVACFVLFTVSHDAAHNSVSSNEHVTTWLGRLSTVMFAAHAGFRTWRFIHMQHHRFTNHDDGRDPDHWTHSGPKALLPLKWLTVDLWYMVFYLPKLGSRPKAERLELFATWAVVGAVAAALIATGNAFELVVLYLVPMRLAVAFLAWSFDYLPHHGLEDHTQTTDKFKATRNRIGAEKVLSPLLLNQNYHLVHHLHPRIPFHRYVAVWRKAEDRYLEHDPSLSTAGGRPLTVEEYRRLREMH